MTDNEKVLRMALEFIADNKHSDLVGDPWRWAGNIAKKALAATAPPTDKITGICSAEEWLEDNCAGVVDGRELYDGRRLRDFIRAIQADAVKANGAKALPEGWVAVRKDVRGADIEFAALDGYRGDKFADVVSNIELYIAAQPPCPAVDQESAWQTMETAPRDGTQILLYSQDGQQVGRYYEGSNGWGTNEFRVGTVREPTHWQPLPPKPEGEKP